MQRRPAEGGTPLRYRRLNIAIGEKVRRSGMGARSGMGTPPVVPLRRIFSRARRRQGRLSILRFLAGVAPHPLSHSRACVMMADPDGEAWTRGTVGRRLQLNCFDLGWEAYSVGPQYPLVRGDASDHLKSKVCRLAATTYLTAGLPRATSHLMMSLHDCSVRGSTLVRTGYGRRVDRSAIERMNVMRGAGDQIPDSSAIDLVGQTDSDSTVCGSAEATRDVPGQTGVTPRREPGNSRMCSSTLEAGPDSGESEDERQAEATSFNNPPRSEHTKPAQTSEQHEPNTKLTPTIPSEGRKQKEKLRRPNCFRGRRHGAQSN